MIKMIVAKLSTKSVHKFVRYNVGKLFIELFSTSNLDIDVMQIVKYKYNPANYVQNYIKKQFDFHRPFVLTCVPDCESDLKELMEVLDIKPNEILVIHGDEKESLTLQHTNLGTFLTLTIEMEDDLEKQVKKNEREAVLQKVRDKFDFVIKMIKHSDQIASMISIQQNAVK